MKTIMCETYILGALLLVDTFSTVYLLSRGLAVESNPLLAVPLALGGIAGFLLVKLGAFTIAPLAAIELLKRGHPALRVILRTGIAGYVLLYVIGGIAVNL